MILSNHFEPNFEENSSLLQQNYDCTKFWYTDLHSHILYKVFFLEICTGALFVVVWVVTCNLVRGCHYFEETTSTLRVAAASSSEILLSIYKNTRCADTEGQNVYVPRLVNFS